MPGVTPIRIRKPMPLRGRLTSMPADAIGDDFSPGGINVRFRFGEVRNAPGRDIFAGPAISESALRINNFPLVNTTTWVLMLTESKLFRFGAASPGVPRQFHNVPKQAGPDPVGTRIWSTTVGEDHFFFARGDDIFQWDGDATHKYDVITPSSGIVPKARFLTYFNNRLIAGYTIEGGNTLANRIRWSQNGDFTAWDDTLGLGAGFLDFFEPAEIQIRGLLAGPGNIMTVYTRHSLIRVFPTGNIDPTFGSEVIIRCVGCDAPYTIKSANQRHFYLGYDRQVYSWDGVQAVPIGTPIQEELRGLTDPSRMDTYFAGISPNRQEYWLAVDDGNVFVYDYLRDYWTRDSFPSITCLEEIDDTLPTVTWATITTKWFTDKHTWEGYGAGSISVLLAGRSNSATMLIDDTIVYDYFAIGSIMDRYVETPDYYFEDVMETGNVMRMLLIYQFVTSDAFEVGVSVDRGNTWQVQNVTPDPSGLSLVSFNITGQILRFRFRENNATGQFRWRSMEYEFNPGGVYIGSV